MTDSPDKISAMNPVALYFASGDSLYVGASLLGLVILVAFFTEYRLRWVLRVATWVGLALVVIASPPFSWTVDALFLTSFVIWYVASNVGSRAGKVSRLRLPASAVLLVLLLLLPTLELLHRRLPVVVGQVSDHLVVIGDSISSGIGSRELPWPAVFQQMTGISVKNLARPGAGVIEGLQMAAHVMPKDRVVLIEIGGNDLLAGVPASEFGRSLKAILSCLAIPGRTVAMFELPLLPHMVKYGQIQRRLAAQYGVWLIPKRYFVGVISEADATSDGLHLSEVGAKRMAALVAGVLRPVLWATARRCAAWPLGPEQRNLDAWRSVYFA